MGLYHKSEEPRLYGRLSHSWPEMEKVNSPMKTAYVLPAQVSQQAPDSPSMQSILILLSHVLPAMCRHVAWGISTRGHGGTWAAITRIFCPLGKKGMAWQVAVCLLHCCICVNHRCSKNKRDWGESIAVLHQQSSSSTPQATQVPLGLSPRPVQPSICQRHIWTHETPTPASRLLASTTCMESNSAATSQSCIQPVTMLSFSFGTMEGNASFTFYLQIPKWA